jgi:hypothetical protein
LQNQSEMKKKTVACPARLPQACSVLLAPDTTETATNRCKSPKQNEKKRWARGGTVTHPIQSHTHTRELAYPTAANRRQKETKQPTQGGKRGAARDETLGEEAADRLVGVHVTLPQRRVDLRVGAVHDLLQPLHQLPRGRRHRARRPPRAPSGAHPRRNPEPGIPASAAKLDPRTLRFAGRASGMGALEPAAASPPRFGCFHFFPPSERNTQRRPKPKFQNPPCLALAYLYIPRFAAVGKKTD